MLGNTHGDQYRFAFSDVVSVPARFPKPYGLSSD
jgi:hypothetical protein